MDPFVKALLDYGVEVAVIVVGGGFLGYVLRDYIGDLKAARNRAIDISERQVAATEKLTETVHELVTLIQDRGSRR